MVHSKDGVTLANELAGKFLQHLGSGKVTDAQVLAVLQLLFTATHKQDRSRANPLKKAGVNGGVVGLTSPRGASSPTLKKQNFAWPRSNHVAKLLNIWRDQTAGIHDDDGDEVRPTSNNLRSRWCH